jgi:hypothetical protein
MFKTSCLWAIALVMVSMSACKNKSRNDQQHVIEAEFQVDSSLLSKQAYLDSSLNFKIKAPVAFVKLRSSVIDSMVYQNNSEVYKNTKLLFAYSHPSESWTMLGLDVTKVDAKVFLRLKTDYQSLLNKDSVWTNIQLQTFEYKSFSIDQYVLQNAVNISFMLVCYNSTIKEKPLFVLIYYIKQSELQQTIKSVESSIGSLSYIILKQKKL